MLEGEAALILSRSRRWASPAWPCVLVRNPDEEETLPIFDPLDVPPLDDADMPLSSIYMSAIDLFRENCGEEDGDMEEGEEEASTEDEDSMPAFCVFGFVFSHRCYLIGP